jgi:hypothetical protein
MFKLAFFVLAMVPPSTAQLLAPSATRAPYMDSAIPGESPETLGQGMVPQTANQVTDQIERVQKGTTSTKESDLPEYGQQTKRILYIVPNFNAISVGAHLPLQTAHDKFLDATQDTFDYSSWVFIGMIAGIGQAERSTPEFHQGAVGYGRYYWHAFVD